MATTSITYTLSKDGTIIIKRTVIREEILVSDLREEISYLQNTLSKIPLDKPLPDEESKDTWNKINEVKRNTLEKAILEKENIIDISSPSNPLSPEEK